MKDENYLRHYFELLIRFNPGKFGFTLSLMVLISLTEGVGLLLLVPLLQLVGLDVQQGALGEIAGNIGDVFNYFNIEPTLGIVLIIYVLIITLNAFLVRLEATKSSEIQYEFAALLRKNLFKAITQSKWLFFSKKRSSDLAHALTNEIERISLGTGQVLTLIASIFVLVVYILFALELSGIITGLVFLVGIILLLLLRKKTSSSHSTGEDLSSSSKNLYSSTLQHLDGMKTIKSFNIEEKNVESFSNLADDLGQKYVRAIKGYADVRFLFDAGSVVILSIIVFILISVIKISTAELLVLLFLFVRMIPRFSIIQRSYQYFLNMIPAFASVQHLEEECAQEGELIEKGGEVIFEDKIKFNNVSFGYTDSLVINNLSLEIPKGQTTALVGLSGAGKSTIADLVMGLLKPDHGEIKVDDDPLTDFYSWRDQISYVAQETFLFNDTVRNNLLISEKSDNEIFDILKLASAYEFVKRLPQGMDTMLGDRGVRLSGGEKQRLALARALLKNPSLLILDEATSNLDSKNEQKIRDSLNKLHGNLTILIIAHRLSTIQDADMIYLIEDGQAVESGNWESLIKKEQGAFKILYQAQSIFGN